MLPCLAPCRAAAFVWVSRVLPVLAIATAAAPLPRRGGITAAEATAMVKAKAMAAVKIHKSELQTALVGFLAKVKLYETEVAAGFAIPTATGNLYSACFELQATVRTSTNGAITDIMLGGVSALDALSNGAPLNGIYPKDFYSGAGGSMDKARSDVRATMEKLYKTVATRMKKTVLLVAKNGGSLSVDLRPPSCYFDQGCDENATSFYDQRGSCDFLVSVNTSNLDEDGRIWVGGSTGSTVALVTVIVSGTELDSKQVAPASARWAASLNDGGTFFKKGNYILNTFGDADEIGTGSSFSFR